MRALLARTLVALLLAWFAHGAARELAAVVEVHVLDPPRPRAVWRWRWGLPPVEEMRGFVGRAARHLKPGSRIAFTSPVRGAVLRRRWAAYFLPGHDVVAADGLYRFDGVGYWIAYRRRVDDPRLELVWEAPRGAVYRVVPPGGPR